MQIPSDRPIAIAISAMGGQGGGVLAGWIVALAEGAGFLAQATSVPGVAQRTGATIYYVELFPRGPADEAGREPVFALMPVPGEVDIVIASELMEAGRAVLRGLVTAERTALIASSHREYAVTEKMALGNGIADSETVLASVTAAARQTAIFDMAEIASATESVISSVLFGALAGAGVLPFGRQEYESVIERSGLAVRQSLAGFAAGYDRAAGESAKPPGSARAGENASPASPAARALVERVRSEFPPATQPLVLEGVRRLADYQDVVYAGDYLDRLCPVRDVDQGGDDNAYRLTGEAARYLALWMSYEDTIRVADLKTRAERFQTVRKEVRAADSQPVYVVEFLHPGVEEICDTLPAPVGRSIMETPWLRSLVDRLFGRGRRVCSNKVGGFLLLFAIASLRPWRRLTFRYRREMALVDVWLQRVSETARADYELGVETAGLPRLIKGYGETHARGLHSFRTILQVVGATAPGPDAASRIRQLSDAALADEHGQALAQALAGDSGRDQLVVAT